MNHEVGLYLDSSKHEPPNSRHHWDPFVERLSSFGGYFVQLEFLCWEVCPVLYQRFYCRECAQHTPTD